MKEKKEKRERREAPFSSKIPFWIADGLIIAASACSFGIVRLLGAPLILAPVFAALFLFVNVVPSPLDLRYRRFRLRVCAEGADLLCSFLAGSVIAGIFHIVAAFFFIPNGWRDLAISAAVAFAVCAAVFWNGIARVYFSSVQLGIRYRVIGLICGMIPIAHLFALSKIISVCFREVEFENEKDRLDRSRKDEAVCRTKYPILLVHGVFFRDFKYVNYWGRIPKELERNGAVVYYGNHQSALSVDDSAAELAVRIRHITEETGCGKVNVIAHSKGGLDARRAISLCGAGELVASLTTINTPHRGCLFADYLLAKAPEKLKYSVAKSYNFALKRLGDSNPDFIAAVRDLTASSCEEFNRTTPDDPRVRYASVGSKLNRATNGKFPLNFTYHIAKAFDGPNDGLVAETSFPWGEDFRFLTTEGRRGISHGDMVDLNRENIPGFDVREFYVSLVSDLREKGF